MLEHDADTYISTYYFDYALFEYIKKNHPHKKVIMLVTDIVFPLRIWFHPCVDQIIVPTQEIYANAQKYFRTYSEKVTIRGLPIAQDYFQSYDLQNLKQTLGLDSSKSILVFGGGEGSLSIPAIIRAIDNQNSGINIIVVCGKDKLLKQKLESQTFHNKVRILGWIENFPQYLLACDLVISKAGPTTIWECMTTNKPMLIFDYIKGQENGNVDFAKIYLDAKYETNPKRIAKITTQITSLISTNPALKSEYQKNWAEFISLEIAGE
jgi:1,2-diacylglycerol 3-beta-galactosyltransferase